MLKRVHELWISSFDVHALLAPWFGECMYLGSCAGCDLEPDGILLCQKCQTGYRGQVEEASVDPSSCADDEHVGNRHGALICEKKPEVEALPRGDEL